MTNLVGSRYINMFCKTASCPKQPLLSVASLEWSSYTGLTGLLTPFNDNLILLNLKKSLKDTHKLGFCYNRFHRRKQSRVNIRDGVFFLEIVNSCKVFSQKALSYMFDRFLINLRSLWHCA